MSKNVFRSLLFIGIGSLALYIVFYFQQKNYLIECAAKGISANNCSLIDKLVSDFSQANVFYLLLTSLVFMISNLARALRWHIMLEPLGVKPKLVNSMGGVMIAYLTNLTIPRSGEFTRATILSKYENISFEKAFGTVIADRVLDVICLLIMAALTFILAFDTIFGYFEDNLQLKTFKPNVPLLVMILLLSILFLLLLYKFRTNILQSKLGGKLWNFISGLKQGVLSVFDLKQPKLFILYSATIWICYFLMAYTMFKAYQPTQHLDMVAALVVFLFGSLGIIFPSPGGMGSYHFLTVQSLGLYGISGIAAFSYANMTFFTVQIFTVVFFGVSYLIALQVVNKK